ncbi:pentatricopeptide repeat-containing protein At1g62720-like [Zingiber officinale]|uniref:pentatricopeptide repeat-containing protein At1g62720-like n=1 Tax=Zingiber officinale TaxID=94328 RepID=UPI001C4BC9B0|nr:pentatricopeptide repeat-containing protein At1g62720-like [Zingiber officinale]
MISGYFSNGFPTLGFEMYDEMKQSGVCPNLYTCNVLISECCREQDFCFAFQPVDEMSQKGILSNIVTYNTFIGGFCKQSKGRYVVMMKKATSLLNQMKKVVARRVYQWVFSSRRPDWRGDEQGCRSRHHYAFSPLRGLYLFVLRGDGAPAACRGGGAGVGCLRRRRRRRFEEEAAPAACGGTTRASVPAPQRDRGRLRRLWRT